MTKLRIAVQGCCHGELKQIFEKVSELHSVQPIDLLIILGDFQSLRDELDLESISIPPRYRKYGDFKEFYFDDSLAPPVMTIFVGGNHESMRHLMLLPYGGYVANKIYYMGYSSVIWFRGIRIGGLSGIWKKWDFYKKRPEWESLEHSSWNERVKELYHIRESDVLPLFMITHDCKMDIMVSHDWPNGVVYHGDVQDILRKKPFFNKDIQTRQLGNPKTWELLRQLKPKWWLSAHLHVRFEAKIKHSMKRQKTNMDELDLDLSSEEEKEDLETKFLALDKCQPRRKWLEIIDVETNTEHLSWKENESMFYDPQYIASIQSIEKNTSISLRNLQYISYPSVVNWSNFIIPKYKAGVQRLEQQQTDNFRQKFLSSNI